MDAGPEPGRSHTHVRTVARPQVRDVFDPGASREDAERIAASDPYTVQGDSVFELTQWNIRQIMGIGPFTATGLGLADRGL